MAYSKQDAYNSEIKEYVKEILLKCSKHHIPVFMTFAVADNEKGTTYINEMLSAAGEGRILHNDQIVKHALVSGGFEVVPKKEAPVFEEDLEVL